MADRFDVVVAGAGPAGAQCARDLAARDYDVLVLETESEDEFPKQSNKSTAGTFPSMMTSFSVPDEVVMQFTDGVVLESANEQFRQDQPGAVLEFADFKRFLVADGREKGATYRFDARATAPITEDPPADAGGDTGDDEQAVGVRYNGDEEVYADVVVDATGPAAPLASAMDVSDLQRDHQAIGIEYEYENVAVDHPAFDVSLADKMMLRLDHEYAPGGYSWIFHTGGDTAKVGLCFIQNESYRRHNSADLTIDGFLDHFEASDPRLVDADRLEGKQHRGSAHVQPPGRLSTHGFLAIGDTVPTIDPLWGEGIHKGMKSARAAAVAIDQALTPRAPDVSAEALSLYDDLWHERVAPGADRRLFMTELLYFADNDRYDRLLADLRRLDRDTLAKANAGNKRAIASLLHLEDLPMLATFARHRLES